jgi:HD-GYP domain-containing protein (c-di-GMP phosphodiesterase class II)
MSLASSRLPSIAVRLNRLVIIAVGVALAFATALNLWRDLENYAASKQQTMLATAEVFGAAASQAVAAGDAGRVSQALRAVARIPGLERAEVTDAQGAPLADIGVMARLTSDPLLDVANDISLWDMLASRTISIAVPVVDGGREVGRLTLVTNTAGLGHQLLVTLMMTIGGATVTLLLGLLLASRLQRSITRPLVALTRAMENAGPVEGMVSVPELGNDRETATLAGSFNRMMGEIRSATAEILDREAEIIGRLSRAAEQRDDQTGQHVARVASVSRIIAESLGLDAAFTADLYRASPMHDIGKISVPDAILFKPGRLGVEERVEMELHAEAGYKVLAGSKSKLVQLASEIALSHHERWDGTGYPRRLKGEDIPLSGRITAVADVCDALLSERPYKKAWPLDEVRKHLTDNAGTHFDPRCVDALVARWDRLAEVYGRRDPSVDAAAQPTGGAVGSLA